MDDFHQFRDLFWTKLNFFEEELYRSCDVELCHSKLIFSNPKNARTNKKGTKVNNNNNFGDK